MKDSGKSVKINTTSEIPSGHTPGLDTTLKGMEEFDMNKINDVGGSHPEINGRPPSSK